MAGGMVCGKDVKALHRLLWVRKRHAGVGDSYGRCWTYVWLMVGDGAVAGVRPVKVWGMKHQSL